MNTGPKRQRRVAVIRFELRRAAIVRFVVVREFPDCVRVGSFAVRARPGVNRIRFGGRLGGEPLPPGTYSLHATAIRGGKRTSLGRTRIVIAAPGASAARARPTASVCGAAIGATIARGPSRADLLLAHEGSGTLAERADVVAAAEDVQKHGDGGEAAVVATGGRDGSARDGRILGTLPNLFNDAPAWLQPLLLSALALAIVLLAAAALPMRAVRPAGAAPAVERRRAELALTGAVLLGVVAVAALVV